MKILQKLDQLTERLGKIPLPEDIVSLYNEILKDIDYYFNHQDEIPIEDKDLKELWKLFEQQRYEISGKRYTKRSREIAIKKIYELADKDWTQFRNLLEWSIALGYPDITPQLLTYIETQKKEGVLFRDSKYADYKEFVWFFRKKDYYFTADFQHYYERILSWSESKNIRKRHWGYTALMFIEKDLLSDKLIRISEDKRSKETILGPSLKDLWQKIISEATGLSHTLSKATPINLYRFRLLLECNNTTMQTIENNIAMLKPIFYKYNIRMLEYKIKDNERKN